MRTTSQSSISALSANISLQKRKGKNPNTYRLHPLLNSRHQSVKMIAECLQTRWVKEQATLAGSMRCCARRGPTSLRESNLLVLSQQLNLLRCQAKLCIRNWCRRRRHSGFVSCDVTDFVFVKSDCPALAPHWPISFPRSKPMLCFLDLN